MPQRYRLTKLRNCGLIHPNHDHLPVKRRNCARNRRNCILSSFTFNGSPSPKLVTTTPISMTQADPVMAVLRATRRSCEQKDRLIILKRAVAQR